VDNDPVVLSHARALLTSDPAGVTSYIDADARDPGAILAEAGTVLDFGAPAAVIMVDLLNFIERDEAARAATSTLMAAVAPGSYLAIMHPASDLDPALPEAVRPGGRGRPGQGAVARPVRSRGSTGRPPAGRPGR